MTQRPDPSSALATLKLAHRLRIDDLDAGSGVPAHLGRQVKSAHRRLGMGQRQSSACENMTLKPRSEDMVS